MTHAESVSRAKQATGLYWPALAEATKIGERTLKRWASGGKPHPVLWGAFTRWCWAYFWWADFADDWPDKLALTNLAKGCTLQVDTQSNGGEE